MAKISDYTNEQITKLDCDAFAFAESAKLTGQRRDSMGALHGSTIHNSLTTAMLVNMGLSLELRLKLVHCKLATPIAPTKLYTHNLAKLYDLLEPSCPNHT